MIAYWLIPAEADRTKLVQMIKVIAHQCGGPLFEPHVTVMVSNDDEPHAIAIAAAVAREACPIDLEVVGLVLGDSYTKRLYLQLVCNPGVANVHQAIRAKCGEPNDYSLDPHLSLLYADSADGEWAGLLSDLRSIRFDKLQAIVFEPPITTPEDVENWRTVTMVKLGDTNPKAAK